jgi:Tfp pilus assembly protein FimT
MTLVYHGTTLVGALHIARSGAILSPLAQRMREIQSDLDDVTGRGACARERHQSSFAGKTVEARALDELSMKFGTHDIEPRVKRVSFKRELAEAASYMGCSRKNRFLVDTAHGGTVVLEVDLTPVQIAEVRAFSKVESGALPINMYVKNGVPLTLLHAAYVSPYCMGAARKELADVFSRFHARFLSLEEFV